MNSDLPKQFIEVHRKPLLFYTLEKFHQTSLNIEIILVLPENQVDYWKELCAQHPNWKVPHQIVVGGNTRYHSVKNGLQVIPNKGFVAIHDGVRPCISTSFIEELFSICQKMKSAVPFTPMTDSIRKTEGNNNQAIPRKDYVRVQTPQCFDLSLLQEAYQKIEYSESITDDAHILELSGHTIHLVEGERSNIKITYPEDLVYFKYWLDQQTTI